MKLFSFLFSFLVAGAAFALPLELTWTSVTKDINGDLLLAAPGYRIYRKTSLENFKPIGTTKNARWTWLVPSIGRASYYVTAFNEAGESDPSNTIKVVVERIAREED